MGDEVRYVPGGGEAWRDPWPRYARLRDEAPLWHDEAGDFWVLSRFEDVFTAARDHETFSSADGLTVVYGDREKAGLTDDAVPIVMMDPPAHTVVRRPVGRRLTPRSVAGYEPLVREAARACVARMRDLGSCDAVAEMFRPLPGVVVAALLGVPTEDRPRLDAWTDAIVSGGDALSDPGPVKGAVMELVAYFAELIDRRRTDRGDDVFSSLLDAIDEGAPITEVQMYGVAFTMVAGGNDTMTGLLGGAAEWLTRRPEQRRLLLDDPSLMGSAVEEFLRLSSPLHAIARTVTRDVELHGAVIPAGRKVALLYGSANRDPREFGADAEDCDIRRANPRIMAFGSGPHHCVGAAIARLQARVALEELLAGCPRFAVDADAVTWAPGAVVRRPTSMPFVADAG